MFKFISILMSFMWSFVFTLTCLTSTSAFAKDVNDWCLRNEITGLLLPKNKRPCGGAPGRCTRNSDGSQGGFVAKTAKVESKWTWKLGKVNTPNIGPYAQVCDKGRVSGEKTVVRHHVKIRDRGEVTNGSNVSGDVEIFDDGKVINSTVTGSVELRDDAFISNAVVHGYSRGIYTDRREKVIISGKVFDGANVSGWGIRISKNTKVFAGAQISDAAQVNEWAEVYTSLAQPSTEELDKAIIGELNKALIDKINEDRTETEKLKFGTPKRTVTKIGGNTRIASGVRVHMGQFTHGVITSKNYKEFLENEDKKINGDPVGQIKKNFLARNQEANSQFEKNIKTLDNLSNQSQVIVIPAQYASPETRRAAPSRHKRSNALSFGSLAAYQDWATKHSSQHSYQGEELKVEDLSDEDEKTSTTGPSFHDEKVQTTVLQSSTSLRQSSASLRQSSASLRQTSASLNARSAICTTQLQPDLVQDLVELQQQFKELQAETSQFRRELHKAKLEENRERLQEKLDEEAKKLVISAKNRNDQLKSLEEINVRLEILKTAQK